MMQALAIAASLWLPGAALSSGPQPVERVLGDFEAEIEALESEYEAASRAFRQAIKKKSEGGTELTQEDLDEDPTAAFRPRFRDLADRAKGTPAGGRALLWLFEKHGDAADNLARAEAQKILDELLADHERSALMERLAQLLRYHSSSVGLEGARKTLERIAEKNPEPRVQAAAVAAQAYLRMDADSAAARQLYERIRKDYAGTPYAKEADGYLYELDHLQVGMVAPDFETTDENGAKWKLSDYRGKVVVIAFWGFW
jgi:hypothetical protein